MFDYEKVIKKLSKSEDDYSKKKRKKLFTNLFHSDEFKEWIYGININEKDRDKDTREDLELFLDVISKPINIKSFISYMNDTNFDDFDHTCACIAYMFLENSVDTLNHLKNDMNERYRNGSLNSKNVKLYEEKANAYSKLIEKMAETITDKVSPDVKRISKRANLPKNFIRSLYFIVPGTRFVPKYRIGTYMDYILKEIYTYTGKNGLENISLINWHNYFEDVFNPKQTGSTAIAILMEGVRRIDDYQDLEYFDNVREIWDSLTDYAMREMDSLPEGVRRQMIEIYMKKIDKVFRNGHGPTLRVNLLQVPVEYENLANTMNRYMHRLSKIITPHMKDSDYSIRSKEDTVEDNHQSNMIDIDEDEDDNDDTETDE